NSSCLATKLHQFRFVCQTCLIPSFRTRENLAKFQMMSSTKSTRSSSVSIKTISDLNSDSSSDGSVRLRPANSPSSFLDNRRFCLQKSVPTTTVLNKELIYGCSKHELANRSIPEVFSYDDKALRFYGYHKEITEGSPYEKYCIHPLIIIYCLKNDTIAVKEKPFTKNSLRESVLNLKVRQKIIKNKQGEFYHWRDLNVGINVSFYCRDIRIVNCDEWTTDFYKSKGIIIGDAEEVPPDPYTEKHQNDQFKFREYDNKALRFYCLRKEPEAGRGVRPCVLMYFLSDRTIELCDSKSSSHPTDFDCDSLPPFIERQKILKDHINENLGGYYEPEDLIIGNTVYILGDKYLIYDCDQFTKDYYHHKMGIKDFCAVQVQLPEKLNTTGLIFPHRSWGTVVDTFRKPLTTKPPPHPTSKKIPWEQRHAGIVFNYSAQMNSPIQEEKLRKFTIRCHIDKKTISIMELPTPGFRGGLFLSQRRDFMPGSKVTVFGHKFVILSEDPFIDKYKIANSELMKPKIMDTLNEGE
uniref:DM10 domain-containing protein n=1 Tax=Strigamia maritima TaxID=126957 RepID=T1JFL8_STRMM